MKGQRRPRPNFCIRRVHGDAVKHWPQHSTLRILAYLSTLLTTRASVCHASSPPEASSSQTTKPDRKARQRSKDAIATVLDYRVVGVAITTPAFLPVSRFMPGVSPSRKCNQIPHRAAQSRQIWKKHLMSRHHMHTTRSQLHDTTNTRTMTDSSGPRSTKISSAQQRRRSGPRVLPCRGLFATVTRITCLGAAAPGSVGESMAGLDQVIQQRCESLHHLLEGVHLLLHRAAEPSAGEAERVAHVGW